MSSQKWIEQTHTAEIIDNVLASKVRCNRKCDDKFFNQNFSQKEDCLVSCTDADLMGWLEARQFWHDMTVARR